MKLEIFDAHVIKPFEFLGLHGNFWSISYWTVIHTWVGMAVLFCLALLGRHVIKKERNLIAAAFERIVFLFIDLCKESFRTFNFNYFAFVASIFLFTLFACLVGLIPFLDEATKDLNTTFALGTISFCYVQFQKIKVHGFLGFCKEFTEPFFFLAPINIIGELAKIASMSFRLFGNILGGGVIYVILVSFIDSMKVYFLGYVLFVLLCAALFFVLQKKWKCVAVHKLIKILIAAMFFMAWVQMFFGVFEGLIQSFVITMLTTTYLAIGVSTEDEHANHVPAKEAA